MEWKEVRLGDVCTKITDGSHFSPKAQTEGYPMLSVKDMREYDFDFSNCKKISYEDYLKMERDGCVPQIGDVLVAKDGSYLKEIFRCKEQREIALLSSIAIFRPNSQLIDSRFLCYCLKSPRVYNYISLNCVSGSALPRIILKDFKGVNIRVPSLDDQRRIASILSSLDRKIELNNKINADLEEMAQAIFKNWFVDFEPFKDGEFVDSELGMIPEGWKVGTLDEIFSLKYGKNLSTSMILEKGDYPVYGANGIIGYYNEYNCDKYSVLVTSRGNGSGDVSRTHHPKSFITNNSFIVESLEQYKYIELPFINGLFNIIDFKSYCSGSAQPQLTNKAMRNICIISPPMEIVIKYCEMLETLFSHIECVIAENSRLSLLRDTLLPRLMSGELEVPE